MLKLYHLIIFKTLKSYISPQKTKFKYFLILTQNSTLKFYHMYQFWQKNTTMKREKKTIDTSKNL